MNPATKMAGVARGLDRISDRDGIFTMIAADQRESMMAMLRQAATATGAPQPDEEAMAFAKRDLVSALGGSCSALLHDPTPGLAESVRAGGLPPETGLIVTCEKDGYDAVTKGLNAQLLDGWSPDLAHELGADAVKALVQWPVGRDRFRAAEADFAREVHQLCREAGLPFVLEAIVPAPPDPVQREAAVLDAASVLSPLCDIYKTEFPGNLDLSAPEAATAACERFDHESAVPWVILSSGLPRDRFAEAVTIACRAGASGFLAGRAVWASVLETATADARRERLLEDSTGLMENYSQAARRDAVPWRERQQAR